MPGFAPAHGLRRAPQWGGGGQGAIRRRRAVGSDDSVALGHEGAGEGGHHPAGGGHGTMRFWARDRRPSGARVQSWYAMCSALFSGKPSATD